MYIIVCEVICQDKLFVSLKSYSVIERGFYRFYSQSFVLMPLMKKWYKKSIKVGHSMPTHPKPPG